MALPEDLSSECFCAGLPMVFTFLIPGQEAANARMIAEAGAGLIQTDPDRWGLTIREVMDDPERLSSMSAAARRLARPKAEEEIVSSCVARFGSPRSIASEPSGRGRPSQVSGERPILPSCG